MPSLVDDDQLRQMWRNNKHASLIAETMGLSITTVTRRARALGLPIRLPSMTASTRIILPPVTPRPPPAPKPISGYDRIAQIAAERNVTFTAATQQYHRERATQ